MIKVELPAETEYGNIIQREKEVKAWCRKTFGRNKRGEHQRWRGTFKSLFVEDNDASGWVHVEYYLVFFFRTQEQVNWFLLKWR